MKKKTIAITTAALAVLAAGGGGAYYLAFGPDGVVLTAADVTTVAAKDITQSVPATGTIAAAREVSLATTQTGPIVTLDAKVGQRVKANQELASFDTSAAERELHSQRASQAAEEITAFNQIEAAQLELAHSQDALDQGLNGEVNAARASVDTAQRAYDDAARAVADSRAASDPSVAEAAAAVDTARAGLRTANNASLQAALATLGAAGEGTADGTTIATSLLASTEADDAVSDAQNQVDRAEESYARALEAVDREVGAKQRAANAAYAQLSDAQLAQRAAELSAQQQIDAQSQAVNHALKSAAGARVAAEEANAKLEFDISGSQLFSPLNGVITSVTAQQGRPAEGPLLAIADDSSLLVKATVKEADIADIKVGDRVTFTSPSQPHKEYTGTVSFISPVSAAPAAPAEAAGSGASAPAASGTGTGSGKAEFPIEVRVDGNREGLRLGSTAKVKVVTHEDKDALTVPLSALIDGDKAVLVVSDSGTIERRDVKLGTRTDFEAAVTSGLHRGDRVLTQGAAHEGDVGQQASLPDAASGEK
ncbi:TPA: HlyD family efflux transporter periplasmic adaptor subunit [Corynebacterium striatum]|nr:HlyD family efflux transporter periplasmic adaptor subunit [Corynebacterium striatum]HAT6528566.1 HlyD family efflux transporter periplasmic adaptor subunit [Corynebacterium striatum]HAT6558783.1 HlyD family efflux transporter periplasmic adaptor subunit [Corynebacterium striatum]HAT6631021.1 HlyD family efflux transporter periplasmic adaptor subunit [Corynebacterium striatum]HAT6636012.1 HlyD family efflux transporter periplasmic adaptor subunit [Corynebacterium striatum]